MMRIALVLLLIAGVYLAYEFGRIQAGYNVVDVGQERQAYEDHIAMLGQEIAALKEQVAMVETHRDIDREAYKEVEESLVALQAEIQEQKDAVAFYRGIVSPEDGAAGLKVQDLQLSRGVAERVYNVRLVLVQSLQHDRKVSGNVNLSVDGEQNGVAATYAYPELLPDDASAEWPFSFRYFQDFERDIVLPDGFTPERIRIEVQSRTRSIDSIEKSFAWTGTPG
jgi:hypothetical protein